MDTLIEPDEVPELKRQRPSAGVLNEMAADEMGGGGPVAMPLRPTSADEAAMRRAAGQKNMDRRVMRALRCFCVRHVAPARVLAAHAKQAPCVSCHRACARRG